MNKNTVRAFLTLSFLASITMMACASAQRDATPTPQIADESLLNPPQCEPPCWHSLTLGKSNRQDALNFLQTDPLVASNYDANGAASKAGILWWWAGEEHSSHRANRFIFESDLLLEVLLIPNTDITLNGVLGANNTPEIFTLLVRRRENTGAQGYDLEVWYVQLGVQLKWEYADNELPYDNPTVRVCPDPNVPASQILYLTEDMTRQEAQGFLVHSSRNGVTAFPGNELATKKDDSWSVGCYTIASH